MKFLGYYFEPENSSTQPPDIFLNISLVGVYYSQAFFCLAWKYKAIFFWIAPDRTTIHIF